MVLFNCILIIFASKAFARYCPLKFKPFHCDFCMTFWTTLAYLYTSENFSYLCLGIYSLANSYFCSFFEDIKYKTLK